MFECAELYRDNLIDCNLLFVCMDKHKKISTLEVQFLTTGFLHLTGVKFQKERVAAGAFFDKCINKRLGLEEFEMAADGTTEMKLKILLMLFRKNLSANMVGDFSARTPVLVTEKLAGGVKGCMGFVFDEETGYYVPNTVLNLDIRTYLTNQLRIVATFRKKKNEDNYSETVYVAKKINPKELRFPEKFTYLLKFVDDGNI
ncbi:PBECR4 domain-containing protein [Enterocloster bolteae]|uniref:PBECR4 domain-containing protein n=1 Tax=Enterocloster bolteae TaxID=208479 RepID=UPI00237ABEC7|nr:PBECR4 domain-containing protein [Enterocloster bolteae]